MVGFFYGKMLPGVIGGDLVRLGLSMKQHGSQKTLLTSSVLFERSCGLIVMLMICSVTVVTVPTLLQNEKALFTLIYILAITSILIFILFFAVLKSMPGSWFIVRESRGRVQANLMILLEKFHSLPIVVLIIILFLSFLAHFFDILGSYYLAKALHIDMPVVFFLMVMPLVYVITVLPISLDGLGVREGVLVFFLIQVGVAASDAVLLGLLIYLTRISVALLGGIIQFMENKHHETLP